MLERFARILRQKKVVTTLLKELIVEIQKAVPADWLRFDLEDQGRLWSRFIKPGGEPTRPELGQVGRLNMKDTEYAKAIEGGFEACILLGIGKP